MSALSHKSWDSPYETMRHKQRMVAGDLTGPELEEIFEERMKYEISMAQEASKKEEKGSKWDAGKLRVDLLPYDSLMKVSEVYTYGAKKYDAENWRGGLEWKRLFAAIMRHMWAWFLGQDKDPESGLPHLSHAAFGVLTLLNYAETHPELDNRPFTPLFEGGGSK